MPAPRINMHFWIVFGLLCISVFAVCTKWTCSLWTGDALTLTPCSYCAHRLFKITLFPLWVYLHTFPYHHLLSDCSLITRNYIWMERVDLSEKLTLILICQGGKIGYLHFKKDFLVFCCGILAAVSEHINHQILESSGQLRLYQSGLYFTTFPLPFFLHLPLFLCSLVSVSSLTSSYFWLSPLFGSSHPSIQLAGWPKSCAVLELCSGRCKLSVALCSHAFPPLSSCSHYVCVWARKKVRAVARLMKKGEMERKLDRSVSVMENPSRLFHNSEEQEWWCTFYAFVPLPLRHTWKSSAGMEPLMAWSITAHFSLPSASMHLGESPENFIRNFRSECVSEWQEQIHNGCEFGSAAG